MKIPKKIFQVSTFQPADYLMKRIHSVTVGWEYKHFLVDDMLEFIKNHPTDDFKNSEVVFSSFSTMSCKIEFFKCYYLYIYGGVFMNQESILEKELDSIVNDHVFFAVKSATENDSVLTQFIGSTPKHPIVHQLLKYISNNKNKENIDKDSCLLLKELKTIIDNYISILDHISSEETKNKYILFHETTENEKIAVTKNKEDEIILTRYYNKEFCIPSLKPIDTKTMKEEGNMKIGITIDLKGEVFKIFSNGIGLNVLYFGELLLNIGYDVYFIATDTNIQLCSEVESKKMLYHEKFKVAKYSETLSMNFDIVFVMGFHLDPFIVTILKYMNTKIINYTCGNSYIIDTEKVLYNQHKSNQTFVSFKEQMYDKIWCIPQMYHTNQYYLQIMYRSECIEVPFIWSPKSITLAALSTNIPDENEFLYKKKNNKIAVFEPNISIMKWCFPALLVCENAYREDHDKKIEKVYLNNITDKNGSINDFNVDAMNKIVKKLSLFEDKKISIEGRFNTLFFMKNYADFAVSHQMENNLNYLYLDLAWMGWPIIHNASLCKDVGYYYEEFNYLMGGKILNEVMLTHESVKDEYLTKNRKVIDRYLPSNKELQSKYKKLIEDLFIE
jgi:hypothetical protein